MVNSKLLFFVFVISIIGISCSPSKKNETDTTQNKESILEDKSINIIAQLKGKVKPAFVVAAYQKYELKIIKNIKKENNTWLFSFNSNLITSKEMLQILSNSQFVRTAKFEETK